MDAARRGRILAGRGDLPEWPAKVHRWGSYLAGGPPRQALAQGQSKPHGPQPLSVRPRAASINTTATRRAIRQTPSTRVVYSRILTKSRRGGRPRPLFGEHPRHMPHFAPRAGGGLAIKVD